MQVLLAVPGTALVVLVLADAVMTTLMPGRGGGPLTRTFTRVVWPLVLRLRGTPVASLLPRMGAVLLLLTVFAWVVALWLGLTLILWADPGSVVGATTGLPADFWEVVYFSGFTVFTLGTGDFVASGDGWRVATALASFLGLFLITLAITYLVSVVSAVVSRRSLANSVHLFGDDGLEIVERAWNGSSFSTSTLSQLGSLAPQLVQVSQQHFAYPALHLFVSSDPRASLPVAADCLQEALLVLDAGVPEDVRPEDGLLGPLRRAVGTYRAATSGMLHARGDSEPPPPDLQPLRDAGIPLVDDDTFRRRVTDDHPLPVGGPEGN